MARDGLLPQGLATVSKRGSPTRITIFTGLVVAVIAGIFPLDEIAALANAGTLAAFVAVCAAMLVLRKRQPNAERRFRTPLAWVLGPAGILGCFYLFMSLPVKTQTYFLIWNVVGLGVYLLYASRQAARTRAATA
jgi:APA family basic amino acid/polyamine antiporter